jgi:hypothetical protein
MNQARVGALKELDFTAMLNRLPTSVRDHFLSDSLKEIRGKLFDRAKLSSKEREIALDAEVDVYFGQYPALIFPDILFTNLGWPEEREEEAAELAAAIMGFSMLPAAKFIGPVDQVIDALGFDHKVFPQDKIKFRVITYDEAVMEIISASGVSMEGVVLQRAMKILESYVQEVRTLSGLKDALTKAQKVGGPGLEEKDALVIVAAAGALNNEAIFAPEIPVAEHGPEESHGATADSAVDQTKIWDKAAITAAYAGSKEEQDDISAARTALRADGDKNVLARFASEVTTEEKESADPMTVVAGILMLAEAGVLMKTAKEPSLRAALRNYLKDIDAAEANSIIDKDPENPALFSHYLAFLLKVKADLSANDAARFALKASNAMKKAGVKDLVLNVAFHPEIGEFVWDFTG